mmetsp:Transcript_4509/g.4210  ORF Transcript_4509/g.4210 Transcript_4509/m.4210 type:complete len:81 (+) Transcript_4509:302-544(+)
MSFENRERINSLIQRRYSTNRSIRNNKAFKSPDLVLSRAKGKSRRGLSSEIDYSDIQSIKTTITGFSQKSAGSKRTPHLK